MGAVESFAGWAGLAMGLIAVLPKIVAGLTRRLEVSTRGEVTRFEALMAAQDKMLEGIRKERHNLANTLMLEREERTKEREYNFKLIAEANRRLSECEGILQRQNWHDPRRQRRDPPE